MGTLFGAKSYFQCTRKWTRRTRQALRSIISHFKYSYPPENTKIVTGTLNVIIVVNCSVIHALILFFHPFLSHFRTCFGIVKQSSNCYTSIEKLSTARSRIFQKSNHREQKGYPWLIKKS